jgi:coenzyme PQQ precursor peptide PqqA
MPWTERGHLKAGALYFMEKIMKWIKPEFFDRRFGFEITMYIAHR